MEDNSTRVPFWFWVVSSLALLWNAMGVNAYVQQAFNTESYRAMYSEEQLEIASNMPAWTTGAFAIAVFGSFVASIALFFRKKWAYTLFLIALLAVILQMGYILIKGYNSSMVMTLLIIVVAFILVLFSKNAVSKGWLT